MRWVQILNTNTWNVVFLSNFCNEYEKCWSLVQKHCSTDKYCQIRFQNYERNSAKLSFSFWVCTLSKFVLTNSKFFNRFSYIHLFTDLSVNKYIEYISFQPEESLNLKDSLAKVLGKLTFMNALQTGFVEIPRS